MRRQIKRLHKIISSQRGAAMIVAALLIIVVALSFGAALAIQVFGVNQGLARTRARITSLQIMQDFGVLAQKANDIYHQQQPPGCPALPAPGTIQFPAGAPFCWPVPMANTICVASPRNGTPICFGAGLNVASINLYPPKETWGQFAQALKEFGHERLMAFLGELTNEANAQFQPWMPTLAGAPTNDILDRCLAAGAVDDDHCKVCTTATGGAWPINAYLSNVDCLELQLCPTQIPQPAPWVATPCPGGAGPASPGTLYVQKIGFIPR